MTTASKRVSLHWFRKGLRLHDNPALLRACEHSDHLYPVFCLDPHFAHPQHVGVNRFNFLLECLHDLDSSLRKLGSRLYVLQGKPQDMLPRAVEHWGVTHITFERDTEPYAKVRDREVRALLEDRGVAVESYVSHTLHDLDAYLSLGPPPLTYQSFLKLFSKLPSPCSPLPAP
ncbi:deoxyribodipyrimidine photo-lyase, partial [archaeon]